MRGMVFISPTSKYTSTAWDSMHHRTLPNGSLDTVLEKKGEFGCMGTRYAVPVVLRDREQPTPILFPCMEPLQPLSAAHWF